jgi:hypothetical protein
MRAAVKESFVRGRQSGLPESEAPATGVSAK